MNDNRSQIDDTAQLQIEDQRRDLGVVHHDTSPVLPAVDPLGSEKVQDSGEWPEVCSGDTFLTSSDVVEFMYAQELSKEQGYPQNSPNLRTSLPLNPPGRANGIDRLRDLDVLRHGRRRCRRERSSNGMMTPNNHIHTALRTHKRTFLQRKRNELIASINGSLLSRGINEKVGQHASLKEHLQNAIENNHLLKLVVMVDTFRSNVNEILDGGLYPLDVAVEYDSCTCDFHMVTFLLLRGATSFAGDLVKLHSVLHFAATSKTNKAELLRILVEDVGVDPEHTDKEGKTILWHLIMSFSSEKASIICRHSKDLNRTYAPRQATILHLATESMSSKLVCDLLLNGASPTIGDSTGKTPLMSACESHRFSMIYPICESAKRNGHPVLRQQDASGKYALHYNALHVGSPISEQFNVIRYMLNNGNTFEDRCNNGLSILHYLCASATGKDILVDTMELKDIPDLVLHVDIEGRTLLHTACIHVRFTKVQYLLDVHPELFHAKDKGGRGVIHTAVCSSARDGDRAALVQYLLEYYVECTGKSKSDVNDLVNATDDRGWTALHYASFYGLRRSAIVLLQNGANVDAIESSGRRPIHLAFLNGVVETPMMYGKEAQTVSQVLSGEYEPGSFHTKTPPALSVTQTLANRGADTCVVDHVGNYPFFVGASFGDVQATFWMIQTLVSRGLLGTHP